MKKKLLFMAIALVCSLSYSQGDTCAAATTVSCGADEFDYNSYTTTGFTDTEGNSTNDVFFTITPASVETINIDTCLTSTDRDTKIVVYSDCIGTVIVENDAGPSGCSLNAGLSFVADGVSTYIIMVEGGVQTPSGSTGSLKDGDFEMVIYCTPAISGPQVPVGCNSSSAGPFEIFSNSFEDEDAGTAGVQITKWAGDIVTVASNSPTNNGKWEILPAGSPSSGGTGPDAPFDGITYMNYEASSSNGLTASAVYQEVIDLTSPTYEGAELTFYMHAYGNQMGDLSIGVGTSASGPFTTEYTWSGEYQTSAAEDWFQVGVDLTSYLGQSIYIEFSHTGSSIPGSLRGDMSIDKVAVIACDTVLEVESNEDVLNGLTLYPNPVRDYLNLKSIDQIEQISIYNLLGQQVRFSNPSNSQTSIDMSSLDTGLYIVKIKVGGKTGTYKVIKE